MIQREVLVACFKALEQEEIPYAVLRNADQLPDNRVDTDLDLCLHRDSFDAAAKALQGVAVRYGGGKVVDYGRFCRVLRFADLHGGRWWLAIDFFDGYRYRGVPYLDATTVLAHTNQVRGMAVAASDYVKVANLTKDLLSHGTLKSEYLEHVRECVPAAVTSEFFEQHMKATPTLASAAAALVHRGEGEPTTIARHLRRQLVCRMRSCHRVLPNLALALLDRACRVLRPPGLSYMVPVESNCFARDAALATCRQIGYLMHARAIYCEPVLRVALASEGAVKSKTKMNEHRFSTLAALLRYLVHAGRSSLTQPTVIAVASPRGLMSQLVAKLLLTCVSRTLRYPVVHCKCSASADAGKFSIGMCADSILAQAVLRSS